MFGSLIRQEAPKERLARWFPRLWRTVGVKPSNSLVVCLLTFRTQGILFWFFPLAIKYRCWKNKHPVVSATHMRSLQPAKHRSHVIEHNAYMMCYSLDTLHKSSLIGFLIEAIWQLGQKASWGHSFFFFFFLTFFSSCPLTLVMAKKKTFQKVVSLEVVVSTLSFLFYLLSCNCSFNSLYWSWVGSGGGWTEKEHCLESGICGLALRERNK